MSAVHFFGNSACGWAVDATREGVIAKLARQAGARKVRQAVASDYGALIVNTCRVDVGIDAPYTVDDGRPTYLIDPQTNVTTLASVPCSEPMQHRLLDADGTLAV